MDWLILRFQGVPPLKDLTCIVPCYKENVAIVTELYNKLSWLGCQVIIVDDGGEMNLPDEVSHIRYRPRMGYGYAIKRGIKEAGTSIVCTLDGDGQHTVEDVQKLYSVYKMVRDCKMVIGQRWGLKESWLRRYGRKVLNSIASIISGHYQVDLNSGIRVFDRELAISYMPILCDTFSFTTSLTMAMTADSHKITWLPIDVQDRLYGRSRVKLIQDGFITIFYILFVGVALRTRKFRLFLRGLFKCS